MRLLIFVLLFGSLLVTTCKHAPTVQEKQLLDTLAKLRKKAAFTPMDSTEAYKLISEAYVPWLDTISPKRKLFFRPLKGIDYRALFKHDSTILVKGYDNNGFHEPGIVVLSPPNADRIDHNHTWDNRRLAGVTFTFNKILHPEPNPNMNFIRHHGGNVYLSYPQYNPNTKIAILEEVFENEFIQTCGTGMDNMLVFKRIDDKWVWDKR